MSATETTAEEEPYDEYFVKGFNMVDGIWMVLSGIHPGPKRVFGLQYLSGAEMAVAIFFTFMTTIKAFPDDLAVITETSYAWIFVSVCFGFLVSYKSNQKIVTKMIRHIGKGFHDYGDSLDEETRFLILDVQTKCFKAARLQVNAFKYVTTITFIAMLFTPIVRYLNKEHLRGSPDDGFFRINSITVWAPGDKNNVYGAVALMIHTYTAILNIWTVALGFFTYYVYITNICAAQCKIVGIALKHVVRRANAMELPTEQALRVCLAHSMKHYTETFRFGGEIQHLMFTPTFIFLTGTTFIVCLTGFVFMADVGYETKFTAAFFNTSSLVSTFIFCYNGEMIKNTSENIFFEFYESDWLEHSKLMKNYLLIMMAKTKQGIQLRGGGITPLSLETFSNVMSSAFSYFNVLNAVQ